MPTLLNGVDIDFLRDKAAFIETLCIDEHGDQIVLDSWQRYFIMDKARSIWVNKSRQVGFSLIIAAKALASTHLEVASDHHITSLNLEEAKRKIRYVKNFYDSMPERFKLKTETNAKTEMSFFVDGNRINTIKAHSSKEPRGMNGNIYLDEVAHYKNARKIFDAARPARTRVGGQLTAGSSPMMKEGIHYDVCANAGKLYGDYRVYDIKWWYCKGLCTDTATAIHEAPHMNTPDRVRAFGTEGLQSDFRSYTLQSFRQEYECSFEEETGAFMPYALIQSCWEPDYGDDPTEAEVKLLCRTFTDEPTKELWEWVYKHKKGMIEVGYDVGRKNDMSAMVVTDSFSNMCEVRAVVTLRNKDFDTQERIISESIKIMRPVAFRFDHNGLGMASGERLAKQHGSVFENINFTNASKLEMATNVKLEFEQRRIRIPAYAMLEAHIHSIQKSVTNSNHIVLEADAKDHHGDLFWGLALARFRGKRQVSSGTYSVGGRPRFTG